MLRVRVRANDSEPKSAAEPGPSTNEPASEFKALKNSQPAAPKRKADSTDAVATFLTRRFGIAGGLAWLGVLTFGVVSEQFKTRRENFIAERDTQEVTDAKEVMLASGVAYQDKVIGGGELVGPGLLVGLSYNLYYNDRLMFDATKRPQIILFGGKKSAGGALCVGVNEVLSSMRAGGRRIITVPSELAFGDEGLKLPGAEIPPGATVKYDLSVVRVSIPPS